MPINHIFFHWNFLLSPTHAHLKPGDFHLHTQHWKILYSFRETFPAALHCTAPCDLPVSASHPSAFPGGGWKSLLSVGLLSLLNSLSLYLLQGQKQQKQPGKDCNLQETQYSASLGLMEFHGKHLLVTIYTSGKNAWEHWNILRFVW